MKATGGADGYFRTWAGQHATTLEEQQRLGAPSAWPGAVAPTLATLNSALILRMGGMRAIEGHLDEATTRALDNDTQRTAVESTRGPERTPARTGAPSADVGRGGPLPPR
ncbi:hypothetical protein AQJ58_27150 [Streptomyces sp. DSM 15324]|nr:hypothetical protein AQJ58_27150 [Streptomyces sp. DSM 15324]